MRIGAPHDGDGELGGKSTDPGARVFSEDRRVERLDGIGPACGISIRGHRAEGPLLGAQEVREERMSRDRNPALLVDLRNGSAQGSQRTHALADEEGEEMSLQGRNLFADDHLHPHLARRGGRARSERSIDAIVVGDGDHVESLCLGALQHGECRGRSVGGHGVKVQVRSSGSRGSAVLHAGRSSQIG